MDLNDILLIINKKANDYSRNSESHKCFVEESNGFFEGVRWTLLKLYQMGLIKTKG